MKPQKLLQFEVTRTRETKPPQARPRRVRRIHTLLRLAEVRQSRDDWKAQAERLALAGAAYTAPAPTPSLVPAPAEPDLRRPWRRLAG